MKKLGLGVVLSGGSVRGSAHLGLLQHLEELGHCPDAISGTSAGALIGALYAAGNSIDEILLFFKKTTLFKYTSINPMTSGIFDTKKYVNIFREFVPPTFEELDIPLTVCATNVESGVPHYFNSGDLYKPLLASCAIPLVFAPLEINGMLHIDGGVMDNFPVEQIEKKCKFTIGSYLGNPGVSTKKKVSSKLKISARANLLLMHSAVQHKLSKTNVTLQYPLQEYGYFDQKKMHEIYQLGYKFAQENITTSTLHDLKPALLHVVK